MLEVNRLVDDGRNMSLGGFLEVVLGLTHVRCQGLAHDLDSPK